MLPGQPAEALPDLSGTDGISLGEMTVTPSAEIQFPGEPAAAAPAAAVSRIKDLPAGERPREKMMASGPGSLTDAELLALFFRTGTQGLSAIDVGREMLRRYGSLTAMSRQGWKELSRQKGLGPAKALDIVAAVELGKRLAREEYRDAPMDRPDVIMELVGPEMRAETMEVVKVILLNTRLRLIAVEEISRGTVNESIAHPRDILRPAVIHSASSIVLLHNHPSGDSTPSQADISMTRRLQTVCTAMQVGFMDHIIVGQPLNGKPGYFSFREGGLI